MAYEERLSWVNILVAIAMVVTYVVVVWQQAAGGALADVGWWQAMLWIAAGGIISAIAAGLAWYAIAARRNPEDATTFDPRDRDTERAGDRVGMWVLDVTGVVLIVLAAFQVHWFWIGSTMFLGFAVHNLVSSGARIMAYRTGFRLVAKPTTVGNSIREVRDREEIEVAEVAAGAGVSRQTLIAIEEGRYVPDLELAFRISRVLGVSLDEAFHPESK